MDAWLRLYPAAWRERYGEEMRALLADLEPSGRASRRNLVRGAIDAHLHPVRAAHWPWVAAALGGIGWTAAASFAMGQPVPPDWPGYLVETLPIYLVVVPLLGLAVVGSSTRLGDLDPAVARIGRAIAVLGSIAWSALLVGAIANVGYGPPLAVAAQVTGAGMVLTALALLRAGDGQVAVPLLLAAVCLFLPLPVAAVGYGLAWVAIAATEQRSPRPTGHRPRGRAA